MENVVRTRLNSIRFGEVQAYRSIAILPLISSGDGIFQYSTLGEALAADGIVVTEVSTAGSVPELQVVNQGSQPVLLIDGEELTGAKQNRVLNTSILLKERSETRIPVSCTEQGRWTYSSKTFSESGNVMAYKSRSRKVRSVHSSLEASGTHQSDQGEVWHEIAELQSKAGAHSPTSAMKDVFEAQASDLRRCEEIFRSVPNQVGLLTFIGRVPAGLDLVSSISAYSKLHPKLVRSYALEGLLEAEQESRSPEAIMSDGSKFLEEILGAEESQFPSIGYGSDCRFKGRNLAGSALVHEHEVIHAAFFRLEESENTNDLASLQQRRRRYYRE